MNTAKASIERLTELCKIIPVRLEKIPEEEFTQPPAPGKWSKKQILGHLIDSAANNHQRFVRIQYEAEPVIFYEQDQWVDLQWYNLADSRVLIQLWKSYNQHLIHVIRNIPDQNLQRKGIIKSGNAYTLEWFIGDYIVHMEHHLRQIFGEHFSY